MPGAPLEIRWSLNQGDNWAVVATALTSKIWLIKQDAKGEWQARDGGRHRRSVQDPAARGHQHRRRRQGPVGQHVHGRQDPLLRPVAIPSIPKQTYEKVTGKQVNMVSQSWDGKRVYITSSLLANWDKTGENDEQFLRAFNWDGKELTPAFEVDFYKEKLGPRPPHEVRDQRHQGRL